MNVYKYVGGNVGTIVWHDLKLAVDSNIGDIYFEIMQKLQRKTNAPYNNTGIYDSGVY